MGNGGLLEERVGYIIVGFVVFMGLILSMTISLWLQRDHQQVSLRPYKVYFSGSVSGLSVGSAVKYRGIRVGSINTIRIPQKNAEPISVEIMIDKATPVTEGSKASLQMAGITGESYLEISGSNQTSEKLLSEDGDAMPVIPSESSSIEKIVSTAPELLFNADALIQKISSTFSEDNRAHLSKSLENIESITQALVDSQNDYKQTMENLRYVSGEMRATMLIVNSTMQTVDATGQSVNRLVKDVHPAIVRFAETGLPTFVRLTDKLMSTLGNINDVLQVIESKIEYLIPDAGERSYKLK